MKLVALLLLLLFLLGGLGLWLLLAPETPAPPPDETPAPPSGPVECPFECCPGSDLYEEKLCPPQATHCLEGHCYDFWVKLSQDEGGDSLLTSHLEQDIYCAESTTGALVEFYFRNTQNLHGELTCSLEDADDREYDTLDLATVSSNDFQQVSCFFPDAQLVAGSTYTFRATLSTSECSSRWGEFEVGEPNLILPEAEYLNTRCEHRTHEQTLRHTFAVAQPVQEHAPCQYECCVGEVGVRNRFCPPGYQCLGHQCLEYGASGEVDCEEDWHCLEGQNLQVKQCVSPQGALFSHTRTWEWCRYDEEKPQEYLGCDAWCDCDDPRFQELGQNELPRLPTLEATLLADLDWLDDQVTFTRDYFGEKNTAAETAFEETQGVCSHFALVFAALARRQGVPTRLVTGCVGVPPCGNWDLLCKARNQDFMRMLFGRVNTGTGAHAWVEVWRDGDWQLLDPRLGFDPWADYYPLELVEDDSEEVFDLPPKVRCDVYET